MLMLKKAIDNIETIGALKQAIASVPDDTPLEDSFNRSMCLIYHEGGSRNDGNPEPSPDYVEFR
jgi:hypothetical protein